MGIRGSNTRMQIQLMLTILFSIAFCGFTVGCRFLHKAVIVPLRICRAHANNNLILGLTGRSLFTGAVFERSTGQEYKIFF